MNCIYCRTGYETGKQLAQCIHIDFDESPPRKKQKTIKKPDMLGTKDASHPGLTETKGDVMQVLTNMRAVANHLNKMEFIVKQIDPNSTHAPRFKVLRVLLANLEK